MGQLVLVTRNGCHLCEHALSALRELGHEPEQADVDADELFRLYDWRVPVLLIDGQVVAEGQITKESALAALGRRPAGGSR